VNADARTLLVVGDSLSAAYGIDPRQGWVALLEHRLKRGQRNYTVVNASISGDTTANGATRLPELLTRYKPAVVIVELGGNDGLRGLPLSEMRRHLTRIVSQAQEQGASILLVGVEIPPNYGPVYTEKFRSVYREVAREQNVALVPSILAGIGIDRQQMQPDGIHPKADAQGRMLDNVWRKLQPLL